MIGFNPPFGANGKLAEKFLLHSMEVWKADVIIFILPFITTRLDFEGYTKISVKQLPKNSFVLATTGKPFDYPAFLCIYKKSSLEVKDSNMSRSPNLSQPNVTHKHPLPPSVISIKQYRNHLDHDAKSNVVILVRRIGNNCGKHGFVYRNNIWREYRFAEILTDSNKKRAPNLTEGAFLMVTLQKSTALDTIKSILVSISNLRDCRKYKRTISTEDILDAIVSID